MAADKDRPGEHLWQRLERPAAAPRQTLTAERIAAAAVAVADAEGLDAITMRRLATELGVAPMAAYRHVSGKDELLELMVNHIYADLRLPEAAEWRETMRALALGSRKLMLEHLWLAQLSPRALLALTPARMAIAERSLASLKDQGLDADTMMAVFRAVDAYVNGAMNYELALKSLMHEHGWTEGGQVRADLAPQMTWHMQTGRYPTFRRYLDTATRKDSLQWQFETGLDYVLDGIATHLASIR
ncbi:TetR/AcrR family transcriptional regulator [Actinomadura mexicana]|uniref:Transcriptional regulator, TetR family n=1 Tax=Actinomadura mexicana TaxID=134959 RepID=A0A239CL90_9ACTN|nr:TetR/AcrR family transcriptional regulator C-terminal domain-containing protein [Actinomadura mexicana]SNS20103.1 transcriptional regulator, TetR family [Actinomadura mexicana]